MIGIAAGMETLGASLAAWMLSAGAARRRSIAIGTFPAAFVAVVTLFAAVRGELRPAVAVLLGVVTVAAVVDARSGFIFDALTVGLIAGALIEACCSGLEAAAIAGGAKVACGPLLLHLITKQRGLGLGDVKLSAGIGATLGAASGFDVLATAFVAGGAYAAVLLASGRAARGSRIRFGPFLAAGTYAVALAGIHEG